MPLTREKYAIREDPELIEWERVTREFLDELVSYTAHRITAVMVYEWATGKNVQEMYHNGGNANAALRKINRLLEGYFGKPGPTYILSRKVKRAYRVPAGLRIKNRRPQTNELHLEWLNKTLVP